MTRRPRPKRMDLTGSEQTRPAEVVRVVDGDSVVCDVDLGFYTRARASVRLVGLNARELEADGGPEARDHLAAVLPQGTHVWLTTIKPDKFTGRWDARITVGSTGECINDSLVASGWAAAWDGHGERPVPPWPRPEA